MKNLACKCLQWSNVSDLGKPGPESYSLPAHIPPWPQGTGFSNRIINLGEIVVCQIIKLEFIWGCNVSVDGKQGVSFYKPIGIPEGYFALGHYCHVNDKPFRPFLLVARASTQIDTRNSNNNASPPLVNPLDYSLLWSSSDSGDENFDTNGYFWLPQPPEGYKALGVVVTNKSEKPNLGEVKCVRSDLTDTCEVYRIIFKTHSSTLKMPLLISSTRPLQRGIYGRGVSIGAFFASSGQEYNISCLKNLDVNLHAMPNIDQIHALVRHYGPTMFFHPHEAYLPSSVSWFFRNGAMLYSKDGSNGVEVDNEGSNLPSGGKNDGNYWIDLPCDNRKEKVKRGNLESAKLYVHVKPALGGTFTDIVFWVFCPFNGPARLKLGVLNVPLNKIGQHVGDWEHVTLRVSNFTGELWRVYFSQHSGGEWVDAFDLKFIEGNKSIVYSSKSGHASFPRPGTHIQGSPMLGIGIRNDASVSNYYVDSSKKYEIVAAEYLGDGVVKEPGWLQYMREWGPAIVYGSRTELDRIIKNLPLMLRYPAESVFNKLPLELYGEEGPTGPKEKNNWIGDERW